MGASWPGTPGTRWLNRLWPSGLLHLGTLGSLLSNDGVGWDLGTEPEAPATGRVLKARCLGFQRSAAARQDSIITSAAVGCASAADGPGG